MNPPTIAQANKALNDRECGEGRLTLESRPLVVDLGLTLKCNLDCVMCFSRAMPQVDMERDLVERLASFLSTADEIRWNDAGEIFASNRTAEFIELMTAHRPRVSFVSSNFLLIDRWLDDVFESGLTNINVSIDGATKATYETIRRKGKWERLVANLEAFRVRKVELGRDLPRLTLAFVAMKRNVRELTAFVEFAQRYGAAAVHVLKMLPTPTGLERLEQPDVEVERECYTQALLRARELGLIVEHTFFNNQVILEDLERNRPLDKAEPEAIAAEDSAAGAGAAENPRSPLPLAALHQRGEFTGLLKPICPSPWREFLVQTDGQVRACCFSPRIMGDLREQTAEEIWNGTEYQEFRRQILLRDFKDCRGCAYLAKVLVAQRDPLLQISEELQRRGRRTAEGLRFWSRDQAWGTFKHHLKRTVLKPDAKASRVREFGSTLKWLVRLVPDFSRERGVLREAVREQTELSLQTLNLLNLGLERLQRSYVDEQILAEAVHSLSRQLARVSGATNLPAPGGAGGSLESQLNALFYSVCYEAHDTPTRLAAGERRTVRLRLRNTSAVPWPTRGVPGVYLAYSWCYANGGVFQLDGLRTELPLDLAPFVPAELEANLQAPERAGRYLLKWDLVNETVAWFRDKGCPPLEVEVTVE